jgi:site-specific DNA-methyltransferase (adenine-specific)
MIELNRIYNEDCRETIKRIPDNFVNMILTSPPYDNRRTYENCKWDFEVFKSIAKGFYRIMKDGGIVVWVVADETKDFCETLTSFKQAIYFVEEGKFKLLDTMIYYKKCAPPCKPSILKCRYNPSFEYMFVFCKGKNNVFNPLRVICIRPNVINNHVVNREKNGSLTKQKNFITKETKIKNNVWEITSNDNSDNKENDSVHPAVFPKQLVIDHIKSWSNEGDIVYDPFSGCYDNKTELLTEKGWKLFDELKNNDLVASLFNNELKFVNFSNKIKYKYKGNMKNFQGREIDLVVTPDHNMFISKRTAYNKNKVKNKKGLYYLDYTFINANKVVSLDKVKRVPDKWEGSILKIFTCGLTISKWLMFLGFYLGDGYTEKSKYGRTGFHIKIKRKKEYIKNFINDFKFNWNVSNEKSGNIRYYTSNSTIIKYLKNLGGSHEKFIPYDVKQLPKKYLKFLFDGLINSDGCIHKKDGRISYYSTSKKLIDDVMEICLKLGKPCTISERKREKNKIAYCLGISNYKYARIHKKKDIKYNDYVHCITVPSHILLVRRNGKPCFCGNSGTVAKVCQLMNRKFIGSEISKTYCNLSTKTLARTNLRKEGSDLWLLK